MEQKMLVWLKSKDNFETDRKWNSFFSFSKEFYENIEKWIL